MNHLILWKQVEKIEPTAADHASAQQQQQQPAQPKPQPKQPEQPVAPASASVAPLPIAVKDAVVHAHSLPAATATAAASSALTRAELEKLTIDGVIAFLASKDVVLPEAVQEIFRAQMIDGDGLLGMTIWDLSRSGIPSGVAAKIMRKIPK